MSTSARLGFDALNAALKAAGEETRLRVLELLAEAGLIERFREGTWAFFRLAERGGGAEVARALLERLDPADQTIARDRARLTSVRQGPRGAGPPPPGRSLIFARMPPKGTASASGRWPTRRWRRRSAQRSPASRSAR